MVRPPDEQDEVVLPVGPWDATSDLPVVTPAPSVVVTERERDRWLAIEARAQALVEARAEHRIAELREAAARADRAHAQRREAEALGDLVAALAYQV